MIFFYDLRIGDQQICLKYIGIGKHVSGHHGGGNIVSLIVYRILQESDHGIFVQQLVKLLCQVSTDNVDLIDPGFQAGIYQSVNNTLSMHSHQWFRGIESNRYQPASESRRNEDRTFGTVRFQCGNSGTCDFSACHILQFCQFLHDTVYGSQGMSRLFPKLAL